MTELNPHKDTYAIPTMAEANDFKIEYDHIPFLVYKIHKDIPDKACNHLPPGKWQILGEVTKNTASWNVFPFTLEVHSLLAANGVYFENPMQGRLDIYSINNWDIDETYCTIEKEWQFYEDKLIQKALIIQKVVK